MDPYCVKKVELMRCYDEKDVRFYPAIKIKSHSFLFLFMYFLIGYVNTTVKPRNQASC